MTQLPPDPGRQKPLHELARWLIASFPTEPGWDELYLQLRPLRAEVRFRVVVIRGEQRTVKIGQLTAGHAPYDEARALQGVEARPGAGTWIEASLTVVADGWPKPTFTVTARFDRDSDPQPWQPEEAPLDATDLVHHLTRFPRQQDRLPAWMVDRITAAGLEVPSATSPATAEEQRSEPPVPLAVVVDVTPEADVDDDATAPGTTSAPRRTRPEALDIVIDRDGPVLADGTRPGRRRLRLGGSLRLSDVLDTVGSPLPFTDDRGSWIVRHGTQRDSGTILAVVVQGSGASKGREPDVEIHLLSDAEPVDLRDDDNLISLYYCSVPGELEVVLDSARLGEVSLPPAPAARPNNEQLHAAVQSYAADPGPKQMFHVLRQALGGRLVLDATGSDLPAVGTERAQFTLPTLTLPDGGRGLGAFTSNTELVQFRRQTSGDAAPKKVTGLTQSGVRVLTMFRDNDEVGWLVVNPGGSSCPLGKKEVKFALAQPSNEEVKDLLTGEHSTQQLVSALSKPDAQLFVGQRTTESGAGPVMVRDTGDGKPVLIAFTSPAEVAAYEVSLGARRLPVGAILQLVIANRAKALMINPGGPRGVLPNAQVWHLLGNPDLPPAERAPAGRGPEDSDAGSGTEPAPADEGSASSQDAPDVETDDKTAVPGSAPDQVDEPAGADEVEAPAGADGPDGTAGADDDRLSGADGDEGTARVAEDDEEAARPERHGGAAGADGEDGDRPGSPTSDAGSPTVTP